MRTMACIFVGALYPKVWARSMSSLWVSTVCDENSDPNLKVMLEAALTPLASWQPRAPQRRGHSFASQLPPGLCAELAGTQPRQQRSRKLKTLSLSMPTGKGSQILSDQRACLNSAVLSLQHKAYALCVTSSRCCRCCCCCRRSRRHPGRCGRTRT